MKGFTLIEIMIVLCIIGIAAAVIIPATHNELQNNNTQIKDCEAELRQCYADARPESNSFKIGD